MLAIYSEAVTEAQKQDRDLWEDAWELKFDLYAFSPEMLVTDRFNKWITSKKVLELLAFFFVDEAHMMLTWGKTFRPEYGRLSAMRARLGSTLAWSAMSASVREPGGSDEILSTLGFSHNRVHISKCPTDRDDLFYGVQFLQHSTEGLIFKDLAWILPTTEEELENLEPTLFSVKSIRKAIRLRKFLQHELRDLAENVKELVTDFHALHTTEDRKRKLENVAQGRTMFIVCTLAANIGVNIKGIKRIVMVDPPSSFEEGTQWAGRAGRDGKGGEVILCIRDEMRKEAYHELFGDRSRNMKKMAAGQLKKREEIRERAPPNIVDFCNPPPSLCRRDVSCQYYGDKSTAPKKCCDICQGDYWKERQERIDMWIKNHKEKIARGSLLQQDSDDYRILDASMKEDAQEHIKHWREELWEKLGSKDENVKYCPPEFLLADGEISWFVELMHMATSRKRFDEVWESSTQPAKELSSFLDLHDDDKESFWNIIQILNIRYAEEHKTAARRKSAVSKKPNVAKRSRAKSRKQPAEDDPVEGEEDLNSLDLIGSDRAEGMRQPRPTHRAMYRDEEEL